MFRIIYHLMVAIRRSSTVMAISDCLTTELHTLGQASTEVVSAIVSPEFLRCYLPTLANDAFPVPNYKVYFCGQFSSPAKAKRTFIGPVTDPYWPSDFNYQPIFGNTPVSGGPAYFNYGKRVGALFTFDANVTSLQSKVGISFISTDNACNYIGN